MQYYKNSLMKFAGLLGVASVGALFSLPTSAQVNPSPSIFNEYPYNRAASPDGSMMQSSPNPTLLRVQQSPSNGSAVQSSEGVNVPTDATDRYSIPKRGNQQPTPIESSQNSQTQMSPAGVPSNRIEQQQIAPNDVTTGEGTIQRTNSRMTQDRSTTPNTGVLEAPQGVPDNEQERQVAPGGSSSGEQTPANVGSPDPAVTGGEAREQVESEQGGTNTMQREGSSTTIQQRTRTQQLNRVEQTTPGADTAPDTTTETENTETQPTGQSVPALW